MSIPQTHNLRHKHCWLVYTLFGECTLKAIPPGSDSQISGFEISSPDTFSVFKTQYFSFNSFLNQLYSGWNAHFLSFYPKSTSTGDTYRCRDCGIPLKTGEISKSDQFWAFLRGCPQVPEGCRWVYRAPFSSKTPEMNVSEKIELV